MGTKVSKTAIGGFVLGAIALLVAGILFLGAGKFFTKQHTYITYYDGSVKGLNVGSPVMFRGVKIGEVSDISIMANQATRELKIPVIFTLEPTKIKGASAELQNDPKFIERAVRELGLRTQLQMQSFVTGQLMVSLDFFPGTSPNFVGLTKKYPEIPSVPTPLEELQKTVERLPFKEIVHNLNTTLEEVQRLVSSIDAKKTTGSIEASLQDVRTLVRNLNARIDPLMESLSDTSHAAEEALNEAKETMAGTRGDIKSTLESAQATLKQSEATLKTYSHDSALVTEMSRTLRDLSRTSRSFRNLSDYLERHPESLLRGKSEGKGD